MEVLAAGAERGELWLSVENRGEFPQDDVLCSNCGNVVGPPSAFEALDDEILHGSTQNLFCEDCGMKCLGPACKSCHAPTTKEDAVIALDAYYHRDHFICSANSCDKRIADAYFIHEGMAFCQEHFLERAAERCGKCDLPVDGGLRALGQSWHEGCLRCEVSDSTLHTPHLQLI